MRISMQILEDRLKQNYPDCILDGMSSEMNLKRPLFYQNGTEFKKNKVYIVREEDISREEMIRHGDNLLLIVGTTFRDEAHPVAGVGYFPKGIRPEELFNTAQRVFDTYDAWDERMQKYALVERTLKSLLDGSNRIFHNPILVSTAEGFLIDYSTVMDSMPEYQELLQNNRTWKALSEQEAEPEVVKYFQDPQTQKNFLYVEIYDKNRNVYRVTLVETSRKLKFYDEYLLLHLAKYIQQMLEKYTVLQSDISYTLDRLLSNILTDDTIEAASLEHRFENFHWKENHSYFCMNIHISMVDLQNLTVVRFICNRIENRIKGSCAFLHDGNIVVYVNLNFYNGTMQEAVETLAEYLKESYLKAGVSYEFVGLKHLKQYYMQSRIALEEGMKLYPLRWVNRFDDIAMDYLLEKCTENLDPQVVCSRAVLTLRDYDRDHKTEYYKTLHTYITCQMNAVKAAKTLFIHRSTFLYRMAHIKELVNVDLEDPDQLLYLLMTYKLLEGENTDDISLSKHP